jgi:hypothetical protein
MVGDGLRRGSEHRRYAVRQGAGGTRARLTGERATRKPSVVAMAVVPQRDHRGVTAVWTSASGVLPTW